MNRLLSPLKVWLAAILLTPMAGLASNDTSGLGDKLTTTDVIIKFVSKKQLKSDCGKRAAGCAFIESHMIYIPEDRAYGWTGTHRANINIQWESRRSLSCKRSYACVKDGVVHAYNLPFSHRRISELGDAFAKVIGLSYNPRRATALGHELKHILTGQRH
jgi:hypothetical protein